jgi:penicillin amidase
VALHWAGFEKNDRSLQGLFKLSFAKNTLEFTDALKMFDSLTGSFVFATFDGDIGYWATGKVPIRKSIKESLYLRDGSLLEVNYFF